jgi:DNA polymerase III gamma/tau subunit
MVKRKRKAEDATPQEPLHVRHRPVTLDGVIGQSSTVKALKNLLSSRSRPHSYLFTGPSGVGKTTIARILATECNVHPVGVIEIDAATHSGIDAMKQVKDMAATPGFGMNISKLLILDECHSLSKQAWQSWLKIIEEPPPHLFIAFCTTEAGKVPRTIKTRCQCFDLKPVPAKEIVQLLDEILFADQVKTKLSSDSLRAIAGKADGSVRQALIYLQATMHCKSRKEAMAVLDTVDETSDEAFAIVRAIVNNTSFMKVKNMIGDLEGDNVEGIRIITMNYAAKALLGTKEKDKARWLLEVMDEMSEPFNPVEKKAPLLLAAGRLLL